jgi:hypothetical protein
LRERRNLSGLSCSLNSFSLASCTLKSRLFICRSAIPQWEIAFSFVEAPSHSGKPLFHLSKRHPTVGNRFFICRSAIPQWETTFSFVEASYHSGKPLFHLSKRHSIRKTAFFCRKFVP